MTSTATATATDLYKGFINYLETRSRMVPGAGIEPARYFYRGILSSKRNAKCLILLASTTPKQPSKCISTATATATPYRYGILAMPSFFGGGL